MIERTGSAFSRPFNAAIGALTIALCFMAAIVAAAEQWQQSGAESFEADPATDDVIERGRYLTIIAGCNDCHTVGYAEAAGELPESKWLTGSPLGWRGPWGTTYAINLRRHFAGLSEDQWLHDARNKQMRPPMPWFPLRKVSDADLRAIYRYIHHLGPSGRADASLLAGRSEADATVCAISVAGKGGA